ncbi:hypothetical protein T4A_10976, partial [Trichinella pseudospiralis]
LITTPIKRGIDFTRGKQIRTIYIMVIRQGYS